jgi:hypothetical protein
VKFDIGLSAMGFRPAGSDRASFKNEINRFAIAYIRFQLS